MTALWKKLKTLARRIGDFQTRLIFALLYFTAVAPFALAVRFFSDPLQLRRGRDSNWAPSKPWSLTRDELRRQS